MSYDALVWLLAGVGLGVAGSLLLLMLYAALERFRLGQRLKRARHLRPTALPRATATRAKPEEAKPPLAVAVVPAAEAVVTSTGGSTDASEAKAKPVDAKSMVVAPQRSKLFSPVAANTVKARPVAAAPEKPVAAAKPPAAAPAEESKPVVAPKTAPDKPAPAAAAAKPKLTVVAGSRPTEARVVPQPVKVGAPAAEMKPPAPESKPAEPKVGEPKSVAATPVAPKPVAARQQPIENVKALFGEAFTIDKLTVPGALPQPDESKPERK